MYIIACLIIVQLYQTRHPDLAAKPHVVFGTFAAIILVAVSGVVMKCLLIFQNIINDKLTQLRDLKWVLS